MKDTSYAAVHDKLLRQYRRYSLYLCWVSVLSIFSLILYVLSYLSPAEDAYHVGLGGTFNIPTLLVLLLIDKIPEYAIMILLFVGNFIFAIAFSFLGFFARKGKKLFLYIGIITYAFDAIGLLIALINSPLSNSDILLSIVVHIAIIIILMLAFFKRKQLVALAEKNRQEIMFDDNDINKKVIVSYKKSKRELDEDKTVLINNIEEEKNNLENNDKK